MGFRVIHLMKIKRTLSLLFLTIFTVSHLCSMDNSKSYLTLLKPEFIANYLIPYFLHNNGESLDSLDPLFHCVESADYLTNKMINGAIIVSCAEKYHTQIMKTYNKQTQLISLIGLPVEKPRKEIIMASMALGFKTPGALNWVAEEYPGDTLELLLKDKDFTTVKRLIAEGVNPNSLSSIGNAILVSASWENYSNLVEFLLAHKANPNIKNIIGATPLAAAAVLRCTESARILLKNGADVDQLAYEHNGGSETPLMVAVDRVTSETDYIEFVKLLLEYDPDLTIVDYRRRSVIDHAKRLKAGYIEGSEGNKYEKQQIAVTIDLLENAWNKGSAASFLEKAVKTDKKLQKNNFRENLQLKAIF